MRTAIDDPRPAVAAQAIVALMRTYQGRADESGISEIWADAPFLARFSERIDVPERLRVSVAARSAYMLALSYMAELGGVDTDPSSAVHTDPSSKQASWIARLAELAYRTDPESLQARSALGLARLVQDRYGDARAAVLGAAHGDATARDQAVAFAVRGLAEFELATSVRRTGWLKPPEGLLPTSR